MLFLEYQKCQRRLKEKGNRKNMFDNINKEELMEYASVLDQELPKQFFEDAQKIWEGKNKKGNYDITSGKYVWMHVLRRENKPFLLSAKENHLQWMFQVLNWKNGELDSYTNDVAAYWTQIQEFYEGLANYVQEEQEIQKKLEKYYRLVQKLGEKYGEWYFNDKCFYFLKSSSLELDDTNRDMTEYVINLAQQKEKAKNVKGLLAHAVSLQKYERENKSPLFITIQWPLLCFMNWRCKEKNQETTKELLNVLYQYAVTSTKNMNHTYESFRIHEIFENFLESVPQEATSLDWLKEIFWMNVDETNMDAMDVYDMPEALLLYLHRPLTDTNEAKINVQKQLDLLEGIYNTIEEPYKNHVNDCKVCEKIGDVKEHILSVDKMEYKETALPNTEYGRYAFERDYAILAFDKWTKTCDSKELEGEVVFTEEEVALAKNRMKECLTCLEKNAQERYTGYISQCMRKCLYLLRMARTILQVSIKNEVKWVQNEKDKAEKLLSDMDSLFNQLKISLYRVQDEAVKEVFAYLDWDNVWNDEETEGIEYADTPCREHALRPMYLSLGDEKNKKKFKKIAETFDKKCKALRNVFAETDEQLREYYGETLIRYMYPHEVIKAMLHINKKYMLEMKEDELLFLLVMNRYFDGTVDEGKSFTALLNQYYRHDTSVFTINEILGEEDTSIEETLKIQEEIQLAEEKIQEYSKQYFEILDKNAFENSIYELTEEQKALLEKLYECQKTGNVDAFGDVYDTIMKKVINGGYTVGNTSYKRALAKHICVLNQYLSKMYHWTWSDILPMAIDEARIFFYAWAYDRTDKKIMNTLLKTLYRYMLETQKGLQKKYEEFHIREVYESVLNGAIVFPGCEEGYAPYRYITANAYKSEDELISSDAAKVYLLHHYVAEVLEPWRLDQKELETLPDDALTLLRAMYTLVSSLYENYEESFTRFIKEIKESEEHILMEDIFSKNYEDVAQMEEYGDLAFQRDYEILRLYYEGKGGDFLLEEDVEVVKERMENFLNAREYIEQESYLEFVSSNGRRLLYALQMATEVLRCLLSDELPKKEKALFLQDAKQEELEDLCDDMMDLCDDLKKKLYSRRKEGVDEVIATFTYKRQKDLIQYEKELHNAIYDYANVLKEAWENASLEQLQIMKCENFKQLREEMPYLSKEQLEEIVRIYESVLQAKVMESCTSEQFASVEEIRSKCEKIWEEAMKKVEALYTQANKPFMRQDIEPFYRALASAEFLFDKHVTNQQENLMEFFDYSGIALEYYTAMEYFLNIVIYFPLKELHLLGTENAGYEGYMKAATHNQLITQGRYNATCMMGNFGFLLANIYDAPDLERFLTNLRGSAFTGRGADTRSTFKSNIEQLGIRIAKQEDNIAKRRNASAHGGTILPRNKAVEARVIVYDSSELTGVQMVNNLKDTFGLILKILNISI